MANATCSADDCERPSHARGMCPTHYTQWWLANPDAPKRSYPAGATRRRGSVEERFWRYVDSADPLGCWRWTGAIDGQTGYGRLNVEGRTEYAHRVSYQLCIGDLDPELTIDHLCRNRWCVQPLHLEQVTLRENVRRQPRLLGDTCRRGHPLTGDNLATWGNRRHCRICNAEDARRWREQRKAS